MKELKKGKGEGEQKMVSYEVKTTLMVVGLFAFLFLFMFGIVLLGGEADKKNKQRCEDAGYEDVVDWFQDGLLCLDGEGELAYLPRSEWSENG